jgi:hypothetical protein
MTEHLPRPVMPEERPGLLQQLLTFRRGIWENLATIVIALGVVMLMQPFSLALYTWSFLTTLVGTLLFVVVSKFPE